MGSKTPVSGKFSFAELSVIAIGVSLGIVVIDARWTTIVPLGGICIGLLALTAVSRHRSSVDHGSATEEAPENTSSKIEELRELLDSRSSEISQGLERQNELEAALEEKEAEIDRLKASFVRQIAGVTQTARQERERADHLAERLEDAQTVQQRLQIDLEAKLRSLDRLGGPGGSWQQIEQQIQDLDDSLRHSRAEAQQHRAQLLQQEHKGGSLEQEVERLRGELSLESTARARCAEMEADLGAFTRRSEQLQAQADDLAQQLKEQKEGDKRIRAQLEADLAVETRNVVRLRAQIERLEAALTDKEEEKQRLRADLAAASQERDRLAELDQSSTQLQAQLQDALHIEAETKARRAELELLLQEKDNDLGRAGYRLERERRRAEELAARLQEHAGLLTAREAELQRLEQELSQTRELHETLIGKDRSEAKARVREHAEQIAALEQSLEARQVYFQQQIAELEDLALARESQNRQLRDDLDQARKLLDRMQEGARDQLDQEVKTLQTKFQAEIKDLEEMLVVRNARAKKLQEEMDDLRKQLETSQMQERGQWEPRLQELMEVNAELERLLGAQQAKQAEERDAQQVQTGRLTQRLEEMEMLARLRGEDLDRSLADLERERADHQYIETELRSELALQTQRASASQTAELEKMLEKVEQERERLFGELQAESLSTAQERQRVQELEVLLHELGAPRAAHSEIANPETGSAPLPDQQ